MGIKRNKSVLIHLKQEDMPRSETKEKEYYMGKKCFKKKFADFKQYSERFKVKLTTS